MNDHVTISVNHQVASSSSSSRRASEITEVNISEIKIEERYPLLDQLKEAEAEGEEGCIRRDLASEMPHLRGNWGAGLSHCIKMVIPNIILRRKDENTEKEEVVISDMLARGSLRYPENSSIDVGKDQTEGNHVIGHVKDDLISCCSKGTAVNIKTCIAECRICQEEDDIANLESPCACSGSLKFAHHKCIQHWCNEKGDTVCEICQKPFEGGYVCTQLAGADSIPINVGAGWDIASGQPRIFSLASDHQFLDTDYDEYAGSHAHSAACFRSVALMLVALLLLRNILSMTGADDEDASTFFMVIVREISGRRDVNIESKLQRYNHHLIHDAKANKNSIRTRELKNKEVLRQSIGVVGISLLECCI